MVSFTDNVRLHWGNEAPHSVLSYPSDMSDVSGTSATHFNLPFGNFLGNLLQVRGTNRVMGLFAKAVQAGLARAGLGGIPAFLALGVALAGGAQAITWLTSSKETQNHNNNTALTLATIYASMGAAVLAGNTSPVWGDLLGEVASSAIQTGARFGQGGLANAADALRFFGGSLKQGVWNILMSMGSGGSKGGTHTTNATTRVGETQNVGGLGGPSSPAPRITFTKEPLSDIDHGGLAYFHQKYVEKIPPRLKVNTEPDLPVFDFNTSTCEPTDPHITPTQFIPIDAQNLLSQILRDHPPNTHEAAIAQKWSEYDTHPITGAPLHPEQKMALIEKEVILEALGLVNPTEAQRIRGLSENEMDQAMGPAVEEVTRHLQMAMILTPRIFPDVKPSPNWNLVRSASIAQTYLAEKTSSEITWARQTLNRWSATPNLVVTNPVTTFLWQQTTARIEYGQTRIVMATDRNTRGKPNEDGTVILIRGSYIEIYLTDGMGGNRGTEAAIEVTKNLAFGADNPQNALNTAHLALLSYHTENPSIPSSKGGYSQKTVGGTLNAVRINTANGDFHSLSIGDSQVAQAKNGNTLQSSEQHIATIAKNKTALNQSLGHEISNPSVVNGNLHSGTLVVLTDGANKEMDLNEIAKTIQNEGTENAPQEIIRIVRDTNETDDATLILVEFSQAA